MITSDKTKIAKSSDCQSQNKRLSTKKAFLIAYPLLWLAMYFSLAPNPIALLEIRWPLILTGLVGAIIGNLSAIGGGLVFIPVMIFVFHLPPVVALKIALATQSFGMTAGAIGWLGKTPICKKTLYFAIPGLLAGAAVSSLLIHPNPLLIKGLFGPVSIVLGLLIISTSLAKQKSSSETIDLKWALPLLGVSFIGGLISGWVAVGEGEVVAAFLMLAAGINSRTSIATGVLLLAITSIYLTLIHQIFLGGIPWDYACFTILGCVYGASLAPILGRLIGEQKLKITFASIAILDGCLFIYQWLRT